MARSATCGQESVACGVHRGRLGVEEGCAQLGIDLSNHHDALADARAAGNIFVRAQEHTNTWARDWFGVVSDAITDVDRIRPQKAAPPAPNSSGALAGTRIVFTGELSLPRGVAEAKAAALGCQCSSSVSKKTSIVVVGEQDLSLVGADDTSTKQRKAAQLKLNAAGAHIRIMDGAQFEALLRQHGQL